MAYAGDAGLMFLATGRWWTPLDYLRSVAVLLSSRFAGAPRWLVGCHVVITERNASVRRDGASELLVSLDDLAATLINE